MSRHLISLHPAKPASDGEGVSLLRTDLFDGRLDPFLMLDEFYAPARPNLPGFPPHPHRGIQTLTYMLKGTMQHRDSRGHEGKIGPHQLQWMSAGKGIMHSEMPTADGQGLQGFQFWLNQTHADKFAEPDYADISEASTKILPYHWGQLRVLAGEWLMDDEPVESPFNRLAQQAGLVHLAGEKPGQVRINRPAINLGVFVIDGQIHIDGQSLSAKNLGILNGEAPLDLHWQQAEVLIFGGTPIGEPIVHYGPFVTTSQKDMQDTLAAYRRGDFGQLSH